MADCRGMKALLESGLIIYNFYKTTKEEDKLVETVELIRSLNPVCHCKHLPLCEPCRMMSQQLEEFEFELISQQLEEFEFQ